MLAVRAAWCQKATEKADNTKTVLMVLSAFAIAPMRRGMYHGMLVFMQKKTRHT